MTQALIRELTDRFDQAGIVVEDAKLTHLAYAPEIAQVMLRRQQAEAIIAARSKIVLGAVSMVEMALKGLSERGIVATRRRAARGHGQQPAGRAVRRERGPAGDQYRHAVPVGARRPTMNPVLLWVPGVVLIGSARCCSRARSPPSSTAALVLTALGVAAWGWSSKRCPLAFAIARARDRTAREPASDEHSR